MNDNPQSLKEQFLAATAAAETPGELEAVRIEALGKKGRITALMKDLAGMEAAARKAAGQALNAVKGEIAAAIGARKTELETAALNAELMADVKDPTLPPRPEGEGRIHPISQTIDEIVAIFGEMGFSVAEGPDIEDDWHNFTALNIPPEHPARQEHDTFYMPGEKDGRRKVLRTHTSPVQIHVMEERKPPLRIIAPGRTYRCDYDATHSPMFNQVEGFAVDETTHMGHLKGCLIDFCRAYFGVDDLPIRFRPSYFPFTEPSAEVDIGCNRQDGKFRIGHAGAGGKGGDDGDDWLEILGCGMINPNVLGNCGIDPDRYQGFAFGVGVERLAMLKYGIPDLRTFFESDLRWLRHYGFSALAQPNMVFGGGDR